MKEFEENKSYTDIDNLIEEQKRKKFCKHFLYKENGELDTKLIILLTIALSLNLVKYLIIKIRRNK